MRILIVDEPGQVHEKLRSLLPEGDGSDAAPNRSGIFAALSLPQVVMSRLTRVFDRDDEQTTETKSRFPDFADLHLENAPELMAALMNNIGLAYLTNGRLKEAEWFIQQSLELRLKLYGHDHPQTALSINSLARVLRDDGRLNEALERIQEALRIDTRVSGATSLPTAADLAVLASIKFDQGELTEAQHAAQSALRIFEDKLNGSDPWVPYLLDILGRIHQWRGDYDKAKDAYERVLEIDCALYGREHPIRAVHMHNLATLLAARGELEKALEKCDKTIAILEQASGQWHPNLIDALGNRGSLFVSLRDFQAARRDLEDAAKRNLKVRGADHPFIAYDIYSLGRLSHEEGKLEEALGQFEQALEMFRARLSGTHAYSSAALTWKARTLVQLNRAPEAEQAAQEAVEGWRAELGERSVEHAIASATLARSWHLQQKNSDKVGPMLRNALAIVTAARGENDPTALMIRGWLKESGSDDGC